MGVGICLVAPPFSAEYLQITERQERFAAGEAWFRKVAAEYRIPLVDLRRALPDPYFYKDTTHLNVIGAARVFPVAVSACRHVIDDPSAKVDSPAVPGER